MTLTDEHITFDGVLARLHGAMGQSVSLHVTATPDDQVGGVTALGVLRFAVPAAEDSDALRFVVGSSAGGAVFCLSAGEVLSARAFASSTGDGVMVLQFPQLRWMLTFKRPQEN